MIDVYKALMYESEQISSSQSLEIRVALIGDAFSGKTVLFNKLTGLEPVHNTNSTLGIDFGSHYVDDSEYKIKIFFWDTAGHERFHSITKNYYRNNFRLFLLFDLSNPNSLTNVQKWINEVTYVNNDQTEIILIGNKSDLTCKIEQDDINRIIESNPSVINYYKISAISKDCKELNKCIEELVFDAKSLITEDYKESIVQVSTGLVIKTQKDNLEIEQETPGNRCCVIS